MKRQFVKKILPFLATLCISCATVHKQPLLEKKALDYPDSDFIFTERSDEITKPNTDTHTVDQSENEIVTVSKDKKGKLLKTIFSGAVLVREILNTNGIEKVRLTISGNALIRHGNIAIAANQMTIEDNRIGKLKGGVKITDYESKVTLYSEQANYNRDEQMVWLEGNPYMLVMPKSTGLTKKNLPALVSCDKMIRDLEKKESRLTGDVRIHQDSWTLISNEGIYKDGSDQIVLKNNPYIFGINQFITGEILVYTISKKKAVLDKQIIYLSRGERSSELADTKSTQPSLEEFGRMGGKFIVADRNQNDSKMMLNILTSDKISYIQADQEVEDQTRVNGNVYLSRADLRLKANELSSKGKDFHTLYTQTGVEIHDLRNDLHAKAGVLDYKIKDKYLRLESDPILEFYKKGTTIVESTLKAAVIERDFDKKSMMAIGDVHLNQAEFEAVGELARYHENEGTIVIEGNPGIVNQKSVIRCEKIIYYVEKKKIYMYNHIRGYLGLVLN